MNLRINVLTAANGCWSFDINSIEATECFEYCCHLNSLKYSYPWNGINFSIYLCFFLISYLEMFYSLQYIRFWHCWLKFFLNILFIFALIANRRSFLILLSKSLLPVYKNSTDFQILVLYLAICLYLFISLSCFPIDSLDKSSYGIFFHLHIKIILSLFSNLCDFYLFLLSNCSNWSF